MALILLRHARPPAAEGRCYGRTDLAPGPLLQEARSILARLGPVDRIVSSPLLRCRRLAALLGARLRVPVRLDPAWREMDFGTWEGVPWDAVPRRELDAWAADLMRARPHRGESVAALLVRVRAALHRAAARPGRTLAVTHAGPIRAALYLDGGGAAAWRRPVGFGEVIHFRPVPSRRNSLQGGAHAVNTPRPLRRPFPVTPAGAGRCP